MKTSPSISRVIALSALLILTACQSDEPQQQGGQKPEKHVDVVTLAPQKVTLRSSLPARTTAFRQAEVRPQVNGIIEKRLFEEGAQVKEGQQLYQIDAALYQAQVANAKAQLMRAKAALQTAKAKEARYKNLLADNAISKQDYDDALSTYEQTEADIKVQEATLKTAETNLNYTHVYAPISGQIGKSNFTEGALVTAQQSAVLTTITQLEPIYVDISQPSKRLLDLRKRIIARQINQEKAPKVTLTLEDGSAYSEAGTLQFAEVNVDPTTGDVVLRAIMPNPEHLLLPGMYVKATIEEGELENIILAPQKGITFDREGNATALIVGKDNKVELRQLKLDRSVGDNWIVKSGLSAGEQVIVEGLQKVAPEDSVKIDNNTIQTAGNGA
ncbi:efflux RND transporter periplasmic adaptor subunit [Methylophaga sulfidovorans]|uniref:Membrane fusion protein, multidrug efflux system n=1 Tax=Methylophaga sulfidovorans TaxID=45496 RepID=A0A1I3Y1E8_9GAMM|nr:efflux RND transporter periplasmic adaptor subunit [Methylophaga sulfidovorans]SFK25239.1 membrane fusion protein, multidrug efflux system [Methylophaga sulfidovorans]